MFSNGGRGRRMRRPKQWDTLSRRFMPETRTEQLRIMGYADAPAHGLAEVFSFNKEERWGRALKGLGLSWLVAAGTAFIPVAHFLLVPGFFFFGMHVFASRVRTKEVTARIHGICPDCEVEQEFEAGGKWTLPRSLACGECGRTLRAHA
jgi:hypothetical protein